MATILPFAGPPPDCSPLDHEPGSILVVDEDEVMRGVIVKLLRHEGYRVLHASTAEEGVCLADSLPVDLLVSGALTDHRASDPIAALMAARPTMKRVCIGHRAETPRLTLFNRERTMVLERPLSSSTLIESVRAMLEDTA